jgi:type II secretory pathway pseudopilin PulG
MKSSSVSGFSLVEALLAVGVMMIMTFGLITLTFNQNKEVRAIQEKLARVELEGTILRAFSSSGICSFVLSDPSQSSVAVVPNRSMDKIDTSTPLLLAAQSISIRRVPSSVSVSSIILAQVGGLASANSPTLKIADMRFENFRVNGIDQFLVDFKVSFDPATIRSIPPFVIQNIFLGTNSLDPVNAKSIVDCAAPSGAGPQLRRFTFLANAVWTVPSGVKGAFVTMAGGGGSGVGWRIINAVQSGPSAGFVMSYPITLIPGETLTITVGSGALAYPPEITGTVSTRGRPFFIYKKPTGGDDGYGGYPGGASKIERTIGRGTVTILECAGGSGINTGGIDNDAMGDYPGPGGVTITSDNVPGNSVTSLTGAAYGSGSPTIAAPNRPAAGLYAIPGGPGQCGGLGVLAGTGRGMIGQSFWSATGHSVNSGTWSGGRTPLGFGSGGDISVSGCYVTFSTVGTCVSPIAGRPGIVHIDVLY